MHRRRRPHDFAAIGLADRLMAEADAEDRNRRAGRLDEVEADSRLLRRAGAGREHDGVGPRGDHLGDAISIIAVDRHVGAERAQIMHQVPGEAVVIVDQRDVRHGYPLLVVLGFALTEVKNGLPAPGDENTSHCVERKLANPSALL